MVKRFYRLKQVLEVVPVSKSTLWLWVRQGKFPVPIKLSAGCTVWDAADVHRFVEKAGGRGGDNG